MDNGPGKSMASGDQMRAGSSCGCYEVPKKSNSIVIVTPMVNYLMNELNCIRGEVDLHNIQSLETLTLAMNVSPSSRATYTINALCRRNEGFLL